MADKRSAFTDEDYTKFLELADRFALAATDPKANGSIQFDLDWVLIYIQPFLDVIDMRLNEGEPEHPITLQAIMCQAIFSVAYRESMNMGETITEEDVTGCTKLIEDVLAHTEAGALEAVRRMNR